MVTPQCRISDAALLLYLIHQARQETQQGGTGFRVRQDLIQILAALLGTMTCFAKLLEAITLHCDPRGLA